jgi:hypothetical protein
VPLINVVLRLEPFTRTAEPETKLLPLRVKVNPALPALMLAGEMLESDGPGLVTVKVRDPLVPPPGVETAMERDPAVASALAGMVAASCVLLTKAVLRLALLACAVDVPAKLVPVAVRMTGALPATADPGEIAVSMGVTGVPGVMERFRVFEVQPPPSEFATLNAS